MKTTMIMQLCPAPSVALVQLSDCVWMPKLARLQVPAGTRAQCEPTGIPLTGLTRGMLTQLLPSSTVAAGVRLKSGLGTVASEIPGGTCQPDALASGGVREPSQ